jgi:signal transduction histidine kinase
VVHGIVTGHGGRIDVRSNPDAGTVFEVALPLASAAVSIPEAEDSKPCNFM